MSNISFGNVNPNMQSISPEMQKRIESGENFGAIDTQKIKEDTVEITQHAVKENFIFKIMRNVFGVKDPKKTLTSIGLTAVTVVAFATLGNKSIKKMSQMGLDVDKFLQNNDLYNKVTGFFKRGTDKVKKTLMKSKTVQNVTEAIKNKMEKPVLSLAKGTGQGLKIQFAHTLPDIMEALPLKAQGETFKELKKVLGKGDALKLIASATPDADEAKLIQELTAKIGDKAKATKLIKEVISKNSGLQTDLAELVGEANVKKYFSNCLGGNVPRADVKEFVEGLTKDIVDKFLGDNYTKKDFVDLLTKIKAGDKITDKLGNEVDFSKFNGITMNREGIIGSWWPYNIINSIAKNFNGGKDIRFTKGSLGDALLKYNVSAGKCADTTLGKITQNLLLVPGESISNFCCDAAGMNFFILTAIVNLFNTAQDAPKEQRVATVADDFVGSIGSLMVTMPLASAATYGLASLKNIDKNNASFVSKYLLRPIGKVFGMGLDAAKNGKTWKNFPARFGGGLLRLIMIMFVFSPFFSKPINAAIHKVFGKPYDADEAAKQKELEAQKAQIIPELGITQGELMEKIEKNPTALQKLQTDPNLLKAAEQNPKIILDLLDNKEVKIPEQKPHPASQGQLISPANKARLQGNQTNMTKAPQPKTTTPTSQNTNSNTSVDTATYIPSSAFTAPASSLSPEQQSEYNAMMTRSDKLLKKAEQYI